jgi:hypothetical protein
MADRAIKHVENTMNDKKSSSRIMRELIAEQGSATGSQLCQAAGTTSASTFLKPYIQRGLIVMSEKSAGARVGKTFSVAPGVDPQQLLIDMKYGPKPKTPPAESTESGLASATTAGTEKPSEPLKVPDGVGIPQATSDEGPKGMEQAEESVAKPSSISKNIKELIGEVERLEQQAAGEVRSAADFLIDGAGQLHIMHPHAQIIFPVSDTIRIQKLLKSVDLESLCA